MSQVMEALCTGPRSNAMFDNEPDDARDECVRLLIILSLVRAWCLRGATAQSSRASSANMHSWRACRSSSTRPSWVWRLRGTRATQSCPLAARPFAAP
jgi:hypothetical protein